jgi:hypothetical protein
MAFAEELQSFIEIRLQALDSSIDLSPGSPARTHVIEPILRRFAIDPLSTDIATFILDRVTQEYPDLAADDGGMLEDILIKPLQLLLEPFKREVQQVETNQSVVNSDIMSEPEADALVANWFEERDSGDYSSGTVRLYFSQPTTTRVSTDKRLYTNDGLSFFPVQNYFITSAQMLFNRQGNFYFLDVVVRAETQGEEYNVDRSEISSIEEVPGIVKVANLAPFTSGRPKETNEELLERTETSLTERSLVTKRGAIARTGRLFDGVRAMQVIGAGEDGMNRDILTGTGQGFLHITGEATIYGDWLWISSITYRDDGDDDSILPQAGDTIRFHPTTPAPATTTVVTAIVVAVLSATGGKYLLLLDSSPYTPGTVNSGAFALLKPGSITISNAPGGISLNTTVPDNTVHLGGHTDVFIRPNQDLEIQGTLESIADQNPLAAITDLTVPDADDNRVVSATSNFNTLGIKIGDVLVIETGAGFAGSYRIIEISSATSLRVDTIFATSTSTNLRARIVRSITVDLVEPRIPKLPFTPGPVSDLQTNVGSTEFRFDSINVQEYGAETGDTINVLEGPDAGEFLITSFSSTNGAAIVDRPATATGANLSYEIYTKFDGLRRPLVRVKRLEVLDSTGQGTGIGVPYGDAVDIRPTGAFEGAGNEKVTYDKQLVIFPDMPEWVSGLTADPILLANIDDTTDARYTLSLENADGIVRKVTHHASNQIETTEINVPPFLWNGRRDKLIALVSRTDYDVPSTLVGTHRTSDIAKGLVGHSLTIYDGPNQGKYIITDLRVLELWGKTDQGHREVALLQVDPPLKVDPIRTAISLINAVNGSAFWTAAQLYEFLNYAADWDNASGFYMTFINKLRTTLNTLGITYADDAAMKTFFDPLVKTSYSIGPSAKGDFRLYFLEPVSVEFYYGIDPTTFDLATDGSKKFRLSPFMSPAQILPESQEGTDPTIWNRNLGVSTSEPDNIFLTSGSAVIKKGIHIGDTLEMIPAINDLPSRKDMTSSWLAFTAAGSNILQLIMPNSDSTSPAGYGGVDNFTLLAAGQLVFIDSGPDIGAYKVVKVIEQNWAATSPAVPSLKVQLDRPLTHNTEVMPGTGNDLFPLIDFDKAYKGRAPLVKTSGNVFNMSLNGKKIKFRWTQNRGSSWTEEEHTFVAADPYTTAAAVAADYNANVANAPLVAYAVGNEIHIVLNTTNPNGMEQNRVEVMTPSSNSAYGSLMFTIGHLGIGSVGEMAIPNTKRIYGNIFEDVQIGYYVTIYAVSNATVLASGDDVAFVGTYKITALGADSSLAYLGIPQEYIELDRTENFPITGTDTSVVVRCVITSAPPTTEPANTSDGGKDISDQYVRVRLYDSASKTFDVVSFDWAALVHPLLSTSEYQAVLDQDLINTVGGQRNYSFKSPYRFLRPNVVRVSSTAMEQNREKALYYVDLPVLGYGPGVEMNVVSADGFVLSGERKIDGYTLTVEDENFAFSNKERVDINLPNTVLPVGSTADLENEFSLAGQNIQLNYNYAPLVEDIQAFFDSPLDRVTAANILVRHFIPAYVFVDAVYTGGAGEADVAKDVISYLNNIDPDVAEIRSDLVQDKIKGRGASKVTLPIVLIALFHGIDRRIRGMRSETAIGLSSGKPLFRGTYLQAYFIAGPDTSRIAVRPSGEQVFLVRS